MLTAERGRGVSAIFNMSGIREGTEKRELTGREERVMR